MKKSFVFSLVCATASLALAASDSSTSMGGSSAIGSSGDTNSWSSQQLSATGSSSSQAVRASKLIGAEVKDSSGTKVGQIEDVILNPASGKIDFAVISRTGQGSAASPSGSESGSSGLDSTHGYHTQNTGTGMNAGNTTTKPDAIYGSHYGTASNGQLVPVPWSLLQPASSGASTYASGGGEQSFTLNVDTSKLDQAPTLSRDSWQEIHSSGWSQRVNSYFGVSSSSSIGGAESPSGSAESGATSTTPDQK